jgi:hypothetical protein
MTFALSPGQASDAVAGRELLGGIGPPQAPLYLIMDRAYEDNQPGDWRWISASSRWFHPTATAVSLGNTTRPCIAKAIGRGQRQCRSMRKLFRMNFRVRRIELSTPFGVRPTEGILAIDSVLIPIWKWSQKIL